MANLGEEVTAGAALTEFSARPATLVSGAILVRGSAARRTAPGWVWERELDGGR